MTGRGKKGAAKKDAVEEAHVAENKEMKGRGKKAQPPAKKKEDKMVAEPEVAENKDRNSKARRAPQAVEATENSAAPEVKKGRGKAKAKFEEVQEHKESENLGSAETDTKEKRGRGRQASSKDGTEKPAKTSEEPLPDDEIESSLPELSPQLPMDEKRKHEEEWQDFVKNDKFTTQEFLSYIAQWRDCAGKTEPWFQRMKVIYLNLEELKLERDALKEKVESLDQLAIERTETINMHIKELLIEDTNLEANVLCNHQERRVLEKSFMSRNSAPVPSRSTLENSDEPRERVQGAPYNVEKSIEVQEAAPAKRGRGKKAAVSIVDFEEERVEEVKKRVAIAKKLVKVAKKSAVLEEVAAPAEVTETIESPETVPAKKSRGIKAAGKKDATEEAVVRAEPEVPEDENKVLKGRSKRPEIPGPVEEEKAVEVTTGTKPKTGPKSKVGPKSKMETKPAEEEDKSPSIAEPEVAEKKLRGKKVHLSADFASQATPNVDEDGPSSSDGDVASYDDRVRQRQQIIISDKTLARAFEQIDTMAISLNLTQAIGDKAKKMFQDIKDGKHLKGNSTGLIVSGCLHVASRQEEGSVVTFKQMSAVSGFETKDIGRIHMQIREKLGISVNTITIGDFMPRFCLNLGLPINVQMVASHIGRRAMELDIVPGRSPISVAAGAIYMASHASDSENKLTKKEIGVVAEVADVTIRDSYKLMLPRASELFPEDFKLILSQLPIR